VLSFRVTITSRQNPLVARFREAARGGAGSLLLLDGAHLVADAFASRITLTTVAVTPAALERVELSPLLSDLTRTGIEVTTVSSVVMSALSPVRTPSGIVALAERPRAAGDRIYAGGVVVIAVDVQDPGNVGAIVRVAEAGGASGLVATTGTADPLGWKALRGSMGSALRLPIASAADADVAVADARRRGLRIVATVPRGGRTPADAELSGSVALLIGGEGRGLDETLIESADERVTIPMAAPVESLNAAVTAALLIYEARAQRSQS
jgi:RNA methyltransferase, TrmH family